jgi:poly(A) polymerase
MFSANRQFEAASKIVHELRRAGYEAYFAGGCVRDLLLGRQPTDYDVATSATPDIVLAMFDRTFAVGAHFGVVLVATTCGGAATCGAAATCSGAEAACAAEGPCEERGYVTTEVATFRSDGAYSDGRHPDAVRYTTSAEEDVKRRDFTINGLLLDPMEGTVFSPYLPDSSGTGASAPEGASAPASFQHLRSNVLDFVGGLSDLDAGIVRAIGSPAERFEEDRLRMLRAVRFAARYDFNLEAQTRSAIRRLSGKIQAVSRERIRDELTKMLTEGRARRAFELLDETGLLAEVLPEVIKMKGIEQPAQYHPEGDVWVHTLGLLAQLEAGCSPTLAWGALLHDVGKPSTFRCAPDRIRFDGHVEVGVAIAADILRRFRFSISDTRQILALVENHMRFADAERMKASTLKRFFRLEAFEEHLALHRMDCLAASGNLDHWNFVRNRWQTMPEETVRPRPMLTGRELIAAGYAPGPAFKQMLRTVEDAQLEGVISTSEEAMQLIRERFPAVGSSNSYPL